MKETGDRRLGRVMNVRMFWCAGQMDQIDINI